MSWINTERWRLLGLWVWSSLLSSSPPFCQLILKLGRLVGLLVDLLKKAFSSRRRGSSSVPLLFNLPASKSMFLSSLCLSERVEFPKGAITPSVRFRPLVNPKWAFVQLFIQRGTPLDLFGFTVRICYPNWKICSKVQWKNGRC